MAHRQHRRRGGAAAIQHAVEHAFDLPRELAQRTCANQAATALEGMEGAAHFALGGFVRADEKSAIAKIESLGGRVLYIAKDSKEYSVTITKDTFGKKKVFTAADAKVLAELKNAVEVEFQHPDTADDWVAPLKGLTGLKKLHLEKTKITDKALMIWLELALPLTTVILLTLRSISCCICWGGRHQYLEIESIKCLCEL